MARNSTAGFFERLVEAADKRGWETSQRGLARQFGMNVRAVQRYKEGGGPRMNKARELAKKLGVNVEWLLTGQGPMYPSDQDPGLYELTTIWFSLPDAAKVQILDHARFVAARYESGNGGQAAGLRSASTKPEDRDRRK